MFFRLNLAATFILCCLFGSVAKAQLASNKSLDEIYNKKIIEKLNEKNNPKDFSKAMDNSKNLASSNPSLKNVADQKIKKPEIIAHAKLSRSNSSQSDREQKNKLLSNSPKLKQMGKPVKPKNYIQHK
ncbi:hypothetical protein FW778_13080 [Ginsengibacter hankyongi]|uniref:Secreted protein n=1 Tax=Ginsengibacter hankyongi TaxID=2607284 RepID=A0A5J5IHD8_9BACT|nr:hypothetical protein [Ginsengibacter hankyongi]KAA9038490.1 hypothetical protein FW778_13080 [Ginsengibacter hankyongi]